MSMGSTAPGRGDETGEPAKKSSKSGKKPRKCGRRERVKKQKEKA